MDRREFPSAPIVGVGAVVIHAGYVLLVCRAREPLIGQWSLPGGAVELGETLQRAIVREVAEETGVIVSPISVIKTLERIQREPDGAVRYHYVLVDFLCSVVGGCAALEVNEVLFPALRAASDVSDARWIPFGDIQPGSEFELPKWTMAVVEDGWRQAQNAAP